MPDNLKPNFKVLEIEIRWKDEGALREFLENLQAKSRDDWLIKNVIAPKA